MSRIIRVEAHCRDYITVVEEVLEWDTDVHHVRGEPFGQMVSLGFRRVEKRRDVHDPDEIRSILQQSV